MTVPEFWGHSTGESLMEQISIHMKVVITLW